MVFGLWAAPVALAQQAPVLADQSTGALTRPAAALFISGNGLTSAAVVNGYFADPSTNPSFAASAWRSDLGLVIGTNVQAYSSNLDSWAAKTIYAGSLAITTGKTLTVSNTLTFTGTDSSSVAFGAGGTVLYSGGAYVSSLAGTANEITASAATGAVTLSLPSALTFTGKTVTGGTFAGGAFNGTLGATTPSSVVATAITNSALTAGRVTFAGASGVLTDDADMTFATDTLTVTKATIGGISHIANAITSANSLTSASGQNLILGTGTFGAALTFTSATGQIGIHTAPNAVLMLDIGMNGSPSNGYGGLRVQSFVDPSTGAGLEMGYDGAAGFAQAKNRDTATNMPYVINYDGANFCVALAANTPGQIRFYDANPNGGSGANSYTGTYTGIYGVAYKLWTKGTIGTYGPLTVEDSTDATAYNVAALLAAGGANIGKTLNVGFASGSPVAWGVNAVNVNAASGGLVGVYYAGTAKGYMLALSNGLKINAQTGAANIVLNDTGTMSFNPSNTLALTLSSTTATVAGNLTISGTGASTFAGALTAVSLQGGTPSGGTAAAWKPGAARTSSGLLVSTTTGVQLDVGGTLYTLAVLTTNP